MKHILSYVFPTLTAILSFAVLGSITQVEQIPYEPYKPYSLEEDQNNKEQKQEELAREKEVKAAQERLIDLGLYNGEADGQFNRETANSIRVFQREMRLPITGKLDQSTKKSLKEARQAQEFREERLKSWMYD